MRKIILTFALVTLSSPALAGTIAVAHVNGMVCDFCAQSLTKLFSKEEAVEDIKVDLDSKTVTINIKDGQELTDEKINELIVYSGYEVDGIDRTE